MLEARLNSESFFFGATGTAAGMIAGDGSVVGWEWIWMGCVVKPGMDIIRKATAEQPASRRSFGQIK
jgi:hypothetical protein